MPRVEKGQVIKVPYGSPEEFSVYINETLYDSIFNINVQKYLDKVWIFDAIVPGSNKSDSNLLRGNTVKIFIENDIFLKGTIESSKYNTNNSVKIKGIGYVAYKLREKTIKQNEENKSYYNAKTSAYVTDHLCSENLDGASPWIVTTNHVDTYPSVYVRMDNENRLAGVMGIAKTCNYNWYESWGSFPWKTDSVMNIAENKGSPTSTHTFEVSGNDQNSIGTDREEDKDRLYNDITVLGYGDGVNQLRSKNFHATTNRTYLTADMTEDGTETINVADATDLPSSGNVWIGCEKVTYTGKTGTTLTGITREAAFMDGTNVTESYIHTKYIEVYDAQYTTASAQTDSSIGDGTELNDANWGINEKTFTDNSIIKQDILDKIAQYLIAEHKDIVITVEIEPMEIYETMSNMTLGDIVTVNDPDAGSSNEEFRVIGIELGLKDAMTYMKVVCSTLYRNVSEILRNVEAEAKKLSVYMQGAPSVISVQSYENAQHSAVPEDKAMKMKFRVWDKTIAVQDARLDMKILPFRGYMNTSQTASSGGSSTPSTASTDTAEYTNESLAFYEVGNTVDTSGTPQTLGVGVAPAASGTYNGCIVTVSMLNMSGSSDDYDFQVKNNTKGTTLDTESSETLSDAVGKTWNYSYTNVEVSQGDVLQFNITDGVVGTVAGKAIEGHLIMRIQTKTTHLHTVPVPAHTHSITMAHGIYEDSDNPTIKVRIGDDDDWVANRTYVRQVTLDGAINASVTTITLVNASTLDSSGTIAIDSEHINYTGISGNNLTGCTRGYNSTTPAAHGDGTNCQSVYSYGTHNNIDISSELKNLVGNLSSTKRIRIQFEPQGSANTCRIEANADIFVFLGSV